MTATQPAITEPRRIRIQPHRLGMGWHYLWEYDPPIEHLMHRADGTSYSWRETGESSEGCILWLADRFATARLGCIAREIHRLAYQQRDGEEYKDDWVATDALRDAWAAHTILPKRWTPAKVRKLFEDLEDVNYHSFLAKLTELVEQRAPELAARLTGWCKPATTPAPDPLPLARSA